MGTSTPVLPKGRLGINLAWSGTSAAGINGATTDPAATAPPILKKSRRDILFFVIWSSFGLEI
jgi:hypothetical protein